MRVNLFRVSIICSILHSICGNEPAKRLYDDLMLNYNKLLRPCARPSDVVTIRMKLTLSQIIDVHEKDQIMTTSVWLKQQWTDWKLKWNKSHYDEIEYIYVPSELLWLPDLVLYNNAASAYNITIPTKATVKYDGTVTWEPPAIFKSMCNINVEWFPFDDQDCELKFGSWSYNDNFMDLQHFQPPNKTEYIQEYDRKRHRMADVVLVKEGIDISQYYPSVEWDLVKLPAKRHKREYISNSKIRDWYVDITYYIRLRRKPLFYTVNLIFPCVGISFLTILVFYLPSDSGEKISLCISILVALTVFFLLLTEIIPATSTVLPLIGKYLLFTMAMVTLSVIVSVVSLNLHWRTPTTHRKEFFGRMPPSNRLDPSDPRAQHLNQIEQIYYSPVALKAFDNVCFIAELLKKKDKDDKIDEDWKYVAMVLDRLFLWIFTVTCLVGTAGILFTAPAFWNPLPVISQLERVNAPYDPQPVDYDYSS